MFDIDWRGLVLPLAYLIVLTGTFITFSTVYRKRKACTLSSAQAARGQAMRGVARLITCGPV